MHRQSWRKKSQLVSLGWTSDTVNVHDDVLCKTPEMKAHSEKFLNVIDVQVSDEDGYLIVTLTSPQYVRSKRTARF